MCDMHDSPWHGHTGVKKTRKAIELLYTWPSLKDDVEHYVHTCPCCQRNKSLTRNLLVCCNRCLCLQGSGVVLVWI